MSIKKGIYAASMTIINKDLSVNIDATVKHSEKLIGNELLHGCVLMGSTGCAQLISSSEKKELINKLGDSKLKDSFIIGTGVNAFNETVELMKHSINNKMDRFLVMPPAYYKYGDEGCYSFFSNLIQKVPESEIILYNFEQLCGYKFSPQVVERLVKDFPKQILGLKDSTGNLYEILKIPNFLIFPGSELKLLKGLELGNSGIISAILNCVAPLARKVYEDFINKKQQTFNKRLCEIRKVFDKHNLISGLHSFMSIEDEKYKIVLPPLSLLTKEQEKQMMSELKVLDFYPERRAA
tara:strand:- start:468 stop:1352 length:885 start_codon:yes stop_codon:yes gene_type:complete